MVWRPHLTSEDFVQMEVSDQVRVWDDLPEIWQQQILLHPRTPFEVLWHAMKTQPIWIGYVRDDIPPAMMWDLLLHQALEVGGVNCGMVRHPALTEEMLLILTDLCGNLGRDDIDKHKNAGPAVLTRLARDPDDAAVRRRARQKIRAGEELRAIVQRLRSWGERTP